MNIKLLTGPLARVIFVLPFFILGLGNLMFADVMVDMVPTWLPAGMMLVYLAGLIQVIGSVMVVMDKKGDIAAYALAGLTVIYAVTIYLPGMLDAVDSVDRLAALGSALKVLALGAGAMVISTTLKPSHLFR